MKKIFGIIIMLAVIGFAFAAEPTYDASVNALMGTYGPGDTLTAYGFIDHTIGQGTYPLSSLTLRFYNALAGPSLATSLTGIQYLSEYTNPDNLLLDGVYYVERQLSGLSDGQYFVEVLVNGVIKATTEFTYDASLTRNSTLTIPSSYITAGNINVGYTISKRNTIDDVTYNVDFYTPTMEGLGNAKKQDTLFVDNSNSSSKLVSFTSSDFTKTANILLVKVTGTDQAVQDIPLGKIRLWQVGESAQITSSGSLTFSFASCTAKEEADKECTFTVTNNGDYPASFSAIAESDMDVSVELSQSLVQPQSSISGTLTISAVEGEYPSQSLTLKLMRGTTVLQSLTGSIDVQARDLLNKIEILNLAITPNDIRPGDEVTASFKISNTGDFTQRVKTQYTVGDEEPIKSANTYTLAPGQNRQLSVKFTAPAEEMISFSLEVIDSVTAEMLAGRITNVYIEPMLFLPSIMWTNEYKYTEQGENIETALKVRNDGNTAEFFQVTVKSEYASLNQRVYLTPGQTTTITVPVIVSQNAKFGAVKVEAEACSVTTSDCDTDDFTLTVLEKKTENSTIVLNQTIQELSGDQGAVFEIAVQNNQGATKTYSLSVAPFEGDMQISPSTITVLDGQKGVFYLYAMPDQKMTQDLTYQVLMDENVVSNGNLTLSYGASGLTGLITLSEAGSAGAVIIGVALIAALVFLGVKSFNQSKVELKYWK